MNYKSLIHIKKINELNINSSMLNNNIVKSYQPEHFKYPFHLQHV